VLLLGIGGTNYFLRGGGPFGRLVGAELALALAIFVATGFLTSLPPATAVSQEEPANDVEVLEVGLDPEGNSVTSGTATFRERDAGLELTLEVSGLPKPGVEYFGEIHEGVCENGQRSGEPGAAFADASGPAPVTVRFELLSARSPEYAHGREAHQDADVSLVGSADGTGQVVTLLPNYGTLDELLAEGPKYFDLHAPAPGDPSIACGEIG
jgi:Cu/Zn superoxide dismutase